MTMEAETEAICLPVKERQGLWATTEAKHGTDSSLGPSERAWPCGYLDFRLLGYRTVIEYISVTVSHPVSGTLLWQSKKLICYSLYLNIHSRAYIACLFYSKAGTTEKMLLCTT